MVTANSNQLFANGAPVCVSGDTHACPIQGHGQTTVTSSSTTTSASKSVLRVGDVAGCGAVITNGSTNVIVDG